MSTDEQKDWRQFYQAALLELDSAKLPGRIDQAYKAIQLCMQMTGRDSAGADRQALADALANLRVLQREAGLPVHDRYRQEPESSPPNQ